MHLFLRCVRSLNNFHKGASCFWLGLCVACLGEDHGLERTRAWGPVPGSLLLLQDFSMSFHVCQGSISSFAPWVWKPYKGFLRVEMMYRRVWLTVGL